MEKKVSNILLVYQVKQFLKVCSTFLGPPILFVYTIIFLSYYYRKARFGAPRNCITPTLISVIVVKKFSTKYIVENHISSNHEKISP